MIVALFITTSTTGRNLTANQIGARITCSWEFRHRWVMVGASTVFCVGNVLKGGYNFLENVPFIPNVDHKRV